MSAVLATPLRSHRSVKTDWWCVAANDDLHKAAKRIPLQNPRPFLALVHMGGRVYDPVIGRFLSPDEHVQFPEFSQSYNRYSYVLNNPLSYTDPTGEETKTDTSGDSSGDDKNLVEKIVDKVKEVIGVNSEGTEEPDAVGNDKPTQKKNPTSREKAFAELGFEDPSKPLFDKQKQIADTAKNGVEVADNVITSVSEEAAWAAIPIIGPARKIKQAESLINGSKPLYRNMSRAEAEAIQKMDAPALRGGDPGKTYFTDSRFKSADRAKNRLSLETKPEVQMEFRIKNNPEIINNGTKVEPRYGGKGGGKEYMTTDPVEVEVINVQPY